jgi:hypothetical protein
VRYPFTIRFLFLFFLPRWGFEMMNKVKKSDHAYNSDADFERPTQGLNTPAPSIPFKDQLKAVRHHKRAILAGELHQ